MSSASPIGEAARGIANAVGARLGSNGPFRVRLFPAQMPGDVGWASVELMHGDSFRALAVVEDLGVTTSSLTLGRDGERVRLRGFHGADDTLADAAAEWVRGGGLDAIELSALDLACDGLPYVGARIAVEGSWWRAGFKGQWEAGTGSGASIGLGGDEWELVWCTQANDGVVVRVDSFWNDPMHARSRAELPALLDWLVGRTREAIEKRALFRRRPLSIRAVGEALLEALRRARVARPGWQLRVFEKFPGDSYADVHHRDDIGEHFEAIIHEHEGVFTVDGRTIASHADLAAALPDLVEAIRVGSRRLRSDHLRPGATYRVLRSIGSLQPEDRVIFLRIEHYPRDGGSRWIFGGLELYDQSDADCEILGTLHEYLALDLPP